MNRGSATNDRKAKEIASAAKTVFASSVVTLTHSGRSPFFFSPSSPPPPPPPSPSPSPPPPLFCSNGGFVSVVSPPCASEPLLLWIFLRQGLGRKSWKPRKMEILGGGLTRVGLKLGFLEERDLEGLELGLLEYNRDAEKGEKGRRVALVRLGLELGFLQVGGKKYWREVIIILGFLPSPFPLLKDKLRVRCWALSYDMGELGQNVGLLEGCAYLERLVYLFRCRLGPLILPCHESLRGYEVEVGKVAVGPLQEPLLDSYLMLSILFRPKLE